MRQNPRITGCGWTYCGLNKFQKRTNCWDKVTCRNCRKHIQKLMQRFLEKK